jgi:predicted nucleic acid-binding protein
MKRTVLDTNIIISSALGGALVLILERWDQGKFTVIVTSDILREYFEVLNRPKFKLKQETIDKITRYIYSFRNLSSLRRESNSSTLILQMINSLKPPLPGKLTLLSAGIIIYWNSRNSA